MNYQIIFRDGKDDIYIDPCGDLMLMRDGYEEICVCSADNLPALIDFLKDEFERSAAREVAK